QLITSPGVTATRRSESDEMADGAPAINEVSLVPTRADIFIPFSFEVGMDWGGMQTDLATLIADAKDVEEGSSFITGNGTAPNPSGLLTGATITVNTAGTAVLAEVDLYSTQEALPARFQAGSSWLASLVWIHKAERLVAQADASEPRQFNDDGTRLLRRPIF